MPNQQVYIASVRRFSLCLLMLLLLSSFASTQAFAQQRARIVVLPFTGGELSAAELEAVTLLVEQDLTKNYSYEVIDQSKREKVLAYVDPALLKCTDVECALKAAKALSADFIILGTIAKQEAKLAIGARLIDARLGRSVKTSIAEAASRGDLPRAVPILLTTLLGTPAASTSGIAALTADQERQQKLEALEALRADLKTTIAEINKQRKVAQTWGWALTGAGALFGAFSGVSWFMADQAYDAYKSTSDTSEAEYYRKQVTLWDTLMLVGAGAGVLCLGGAIPSFVLSPNSQAQASQLSRVEAEIKALEATPGSAPEESAGQSPQEPQKELLTEPEGINR